MKWFIYALKNTFNYQGRARRSELGWFLLMYLLIQIGAVLLAFLFLWATGNDWLAERIHLNKSYYPESYEIDIFFDIYKMLYPVLLPYQIVMWLASLSLTCRRMHDLGWSGWWQLLWHYVFPAPVLIIAIAFPRLIYHSSSLSSFLDVWTLVYSVVILIVDGTLLFQRGERKTNQYGPDPKAIETGATGAEEK